ncbi:MAG: hypothetical protein JSV25_14875 [Spirochaetota bacterium]|nr:MAG: hypothetical protein JSV25_14875 [Spirochaetota bacterium]
MVFLGLDIGTSGCKGVFIGLSGNVLAYAYKPYPTFRHQTGWIEQDPRDWWQAAIDVVAHCFHQSGLHKDDIKACGVTGHFSTVVLVDSEGVPTGNAILYSDFRATKEAQELGDKFGFETFTNRTGLQRHYFANLPVTKLRWLIKHDPERVRMARWILEPNDYINLYLTRKAGADHVQMGWSGLVGRGETTVNSMLADFAGCDASLWPERIHPVEVLGTVTEKASKEIDLKPGIPVVAGTGDGICGILGAGVVKPGVVVDCAGSTGIVGVAVEHDTFIDEEIFTVRAEGLIKNVDLAYSSMANAGNCLEWFVSAWSGRSDQDIDFVSLERECVLETEGPGEVIFLPYLDGAYSPAVDPEARGAFLGLSAHHRRSHLYRAILEGVAYGMAEVIYKLEDRPEAIRAAGGGAASDFWLQIKADILGLPVERIACVHTGCIGAAILGAVGGGFYDSVIEASDNLVKITGRVEPDPYKHRKYLDVAKAFNNAFSCLRDIKI